MARHFANWISAYIDYTKHSEAPDPFHFWTAISTIAGALRRKVWMDQRQFQWTPNFYVIFVAPPGIATKSTAINTAMRLLREVPDVIFGPNSMTWQGLTVALEESKRVYPKDAMATEFLQMSCLTIAISELGTFLKPKETDLIDLLVDLWDGGDRVWKHRIKTGEHPSTEIINPWMNIIGCTTPAWLRGNFPQYMIEGGLTSRCVFVFGDKKRHLVAYPSELALTTWWADMGKRLTDDLIHMSELQGEYEMTPDAKLWGAAWYENHWTNRPAALMSEKYGGYYARKQTHFHKLAMVLAASQRDSLFITAEDLQTAERIVTATEGDIDRVFKTIGASDDSRSMAEVLAVVRAAGGQVEAKECWVRLMGTLNRKDFEQGVNGLIAAKHIYSLKLGDHLNYCLGDTAAFG